MLQISYKKKQLGKLILRNKDSFPIFILVIHINYLLYFTSSCCSGNVCSCYCHKGLWPDILKCKLNNIPIQLCTKWQYLIVLVEYEWCNELTPTLLQNVPKVSDMDFIRFYRCISYTTISIFGSKE